MLMTVVMIIIATMAGSTTAEEYVTREELALPMNGSIVKTSLPLKPFVIHHVWVRSPHALDPLWYDFGQTRVFFNGVRLKYASYVTDQDTRERDTIGIGYRVRGTGEPLAIRVDKDLTAQIPNARVEIIREGALESTGPTGQHTSRSIPYSVSTAPNGDWPGALAAAKRSNTTASSGDGTVGVVAALATVIMGGFIVLYVLRRKEQREDQQEDNVLKEHEVVEAAKE
jgi:hypothetical protein